MEKKPDLLEYLSIQHYLKDLYKWRKQTEASFSYESWAQELDFKNRSFLRQIVIGRRNLTTDTSRQLARRLHFQGVELEYFELLVQYSRAQSLDKKNALGLKLTGLLKAEHQQQDVKDYCEFISDTLYPRLQTLLSFKDIPKTPEQLGYLLNQPPDKIHQALQILEKIQLAARGPEEEWSAVSKSFKVKEALGDRHLLNYHALSLHEAINAQSLPKDQRRYFSLLLPLSTEDFASFWDDFNRFKKEMIRKFDADDLRKRRLFQMNLNIHAVSEEMLEPFASHDKL
jgi:uncharacterized protein (TIGR02147 family)